MCTFEEVLGRELKEASWKLNMDSLENNVLKMKIHGQGWWIANEEAEWGKKNSK